MTQLRRLGIGNVKETDEKNLCFAISKMVHLRYLVVKSYNEDELLKIDAVDSAPPDLEKLVLARKLEKLPSWFNSLDNLTYLCLHWSSLRNDFLPHIQALPNLGEITLLNAYEGERLDFLEGFQKLKILRINGCCRLNGIVINRGVMPGLQDLYIFDCPEFTTLPHGWKSLPDLKQVRQFDVSPELMEKIWRSERMVRRTIRGINFTRQEVLEEGIPPLIFAHSSTLPKLPPSSFLLLNFGCYGVNSLSSSPCHPCCVRFNLNYNFVVFHLSRVLVGLWLCASWCSVAWRLWVSVALLEPQRLSFVSIAFTLARP
ncbi:hypothetical protein V6N12_049420 [Hibiscus sabdariffa]|uniref:Disease resistance R13L4/SHOC-2-like LRR domain-containing protein n=1 Tax=Hibiscus sabdariffa TaxID=183260 RepID=A0ABR2CBA0_9ROSI